MIWYVCVYKNTGNTLTYWLLFSQKRSTQVEFNDNLSNQILLFLNRFDILFPANQTGTTFFQTAGVWGTHQESYKVGEHGVVLEAGVMAEALNWSVLVERWKGDPVSLHPWNFTWNLKSTHLERKIIFQTSIFRFHVQFQGSTLSWSFSHNHGSVEKKGRVLLISVGYP